MVGRCLVALVCLVLPPAAWGFSNVVIFGDSLSDVGNVYDQTFGIAPQSPPNFQGRYSNGPLWVERLALDQGLPAPMRSRDGGDNWAYSGTKTGGGSTTYAIFFRFPNLGTQVSNYLNARTPSADQLFVVWGGGNDFIDGQSNPAVPVTNVSNHITALANAGAKNFLVPNLPPLGKVPRFLGTSNESVMNTRSGQFNSTLATTLLNLEQSLNIEIYQLDVAGFFNETMSNPAAFGLSNVTQTALVGSSAVAHQDQYLFWDDIHPTRVAHSLLGTRASDLLDTHSWAANTPSASWSSASSWDRGGPPQARWIVNLNNTFAAPRTAVVESNSTVRRIAVDAAISSMTLRIEKVAVLTATERLDVSANGVIDIELAGEASGSIHVGGGASLGGTLALSTADGFVPLPGSSYQVLTYGSCSGDFVTSNLTGFAGLEFEQTYSATSLTVTAAAQSGDANLDGLIDMDDLHSLASSWQSSGSWLNGDFDSTGFIDEIDLGMLAANWHASADSLATSLAQLGLVPEPSLLSIVSPFLLISRRRRHFFGASQQPV